MLIADSTTLLPIGVVELKHHSVHQGQGVIELLSAKDHSLDSDFEKRSRQKVAWGEGLYDLGPGFDGKRIPLVQVGLLTAIHSFDHQVHFVEKYVKGKRGALGNESAVDARRNNGSAADAVQSWWKENQKQKYACGTFGHGCDETFNVPGAPDKLVHGRVSYVCVLSK
jgi:hypothetical protein